MAVESTGLLIPEDDLVSHPDPAAWISSQQPQPLRLDVIHFSINTDSILTTVSAQGLVQTRMFHPRHPDRGRINPAISRTARSGIPLNRLLQAFGMCSEAMPGFAIDRRLNAD